MAGHITGEFIDFLTKILSGEDLIFLINEDEAWEAFVEEAGLSSEQEDALYDVLIEHLAQEFTDEDDETQKELQEKRFLEEFPVLKRKLEGHIRKLRDLADRIDQVHRGCTISNVVTNFTSAASGVLGILGIALAPVTAGGSLLLSATGLGLGVVATVTGAATVVVEETSKWSDEAEAKRLMSDTMDMMKKLLVLGKIAFKLSISSYGLCKKLKTLGQNIRAIRAARANLHLVADAKLLVTTGGIPAQRASQLGATVAGVFLALDVYFLLRDSMHLYDGAKSESAEELWALAQELEEKLSEISFLSSISCTSSPFDHQAAPIR
uniref:Apolipoprotein L3-like n=1 Tax=Peromyscus maniculatus bairdii TaxID=230844 RepID=A0A8C8W6P0_PERMB